MVNYLLMAIAGAFVLVAVMWVYLFREYKKLKQECRLLEDKQRRSNEDLVGLCSAAVEIDQQLVRNDKRLLALLERINDLQQPQPVSQTDINVQAQGYDIAIQKIRSGSGVDELVKNCGLTRDEAVLLISLHGGKH